MVFFTWGWSNVTLYSRRHAIDEGGPCGCVLGLIFVGPVYKPTERVKIGPNVGP